MFLVACIVGCTRICVMSLSWFVLHMEIPVRISIFKITLELWWRAVMVTAASKRGSRCHEFKRQRQGMAYKK